MKKIVLTILILLLNQNGWAQARSSSFREAVESINRIGVSLEFGSHDFDVGAMNRKINELGLLPINREQTFNVVLQILVGINDNWSAYLNYGVFSAVARQKNFQQKSFYTSLRANYIGAGIKGKLFNIKRFEFYASADYNTKTRYQLELFELADAGVTNLGHQFFTSKGIKLIAQNQQVVQPAIEVMYAARNKGNRVLIGLKFSYMRHLKSFKWGNDFGTPVFDMPDIGQNNFNFAFKTTYQIRLRKENTPINE